MRLLFIAPNRLGDAVLSTTVLGHLLERHPGIQVTVVAGLVSAPLFGAVPGLEQLILLRKRRFRLHWLGLWRSVFTKRWDIAVDIRRSAILSVLRTGRTLVVPKPTGLVHRVNLLAAMVGREADPPLPRLWWNEPHERLAERTLAGHEGPVLAVGPTANWRGKIWPTESFTTAIEALTASDGALPDATVAVFGGPDERLQAMPVLRAIPRERRLDLVGKVDLLTAAAILSRVRFYFGNDSGLMHLAAAAGAPTLGLFGPSRDELYAPRGSQAAVVRTPESMDDLIGFPDYDRHTVGSLMTSLTVDRVVAAAEALLNKS